MKQAYKYFVTILLILLFSVKIGAQTFSTNPGIPKTPIEQQEENSAEDNCIEKSSSHKADFLSVNFLRDISENIIPECAVFSRTIHTSLPVQYFAIPTPPPWNN